MSEHARRRAMIVGALALALLSIGAGALIALSDDGERAETPDSIPSGSPTPTDEPNATPEPSESEGPEPSAESPILEDGRHFVYVTSAVRQEDGSAAVTFDLAYFYRGERAEQVAAARGEEVVNDSFIVNDNPRLRTLPLADDVAVRYNPLALCCDLRDGTIDAWLESVLETNQTDDPGKGVPWWVTVEGGQITRIAQHFLP